MENTYYIHKLEKIKALVDDLCFEDQRMSSCGQETYRELRCELDLD